MQLLYGLQHFAALVSFSVLFVLRGLCSFDLFIVVPVGFYEGAEVIHMSNSQCLIRCH